ncbi:tyrosine-type recombinase/integrase [Algibacillus agarilyticus]|uniref:tyrosine-type recombinase/integrase n=1 Tax=Algibacillus agarilyticus TaxID=2234133 RepID=UPI000DD0C976|nr:tyrosine-type recombinase/integrase [Algibacillus agarilyticus]
MYRNNTVENSDPHRNLPVLAVSLQADDQTLLNDYYSKVFVYLPENTRRAYLSDMREFNNWCAIAGSMGLTPDLRHCAIVIEEYAAYLIHKTTLARATIERRLAVISTFLKALQWPNPLSTTKTTPHSIKLQLDKYRTAAQKQAKPVTVEALEYINDYFIPDNLRDMRARLVVNIMFDGGLRASELCSLTVDDVDTHKKLIYLNHSKTDQAGYGSHRLITKTSLALLSEWRFEANVHEGPLLRSLSPKLTIQRSGMQYRAVLNDFKLISKKLNLTTAQSLTTHSARVGAAIAMAEAGEDVIAIMRSGGWKSQEMVARYTEQTRVQQGGMANTARKLKR